MGDPIEFLSLAEVYGANGNACALASAKSNLGHTEAAAGVGNGQGDPVAAPWRDTADGALHRAAPRARRRRNRTAVPRRITPWPGGWESLPRRAAVSSYGMSGTNAHAILEQAPDTAAPAEGERESLPRFFALSASSPEALRQTARRLANWVDEERPHFRDFRLHAGIPARPPAGPANADRRGQPRIGSGTVRLARRRRPAGAGGRPRRPRTGVGVLRAGLAVGGDGSRPATTGALPRPPSPPPSR